MVFADRDNGLKKSDSFRPGQRKHAKSVPECEVRSLVDGERFIVVYHHNKRFKGGHDAEVRYWPGEIGRKDLRRQVAPHLPANVFYCNCTEELALRAMRWCETWKSPKVSFQGTAECLGTRF